MSHQTIKTEGFLHTLTPLCVYDELTFTELRNEDLYGMYERIYEVVGRRISDDWDSYFLLEVNPNPDYNYYSGRMAFNVPMRHREKPMYDVGDIVSVGFSRKYKHFYIIGRVDDEKRR